MDAGLDRSGPCQASSVLDKWASLPAFCSPVLTVKGFNGHRCEIVDVKATQVDGDPIWIGPRRVKWLDAAGAAESVFRNNRY